MDVPELNFDECASVFVRDDFYESIQAPKFHDFCSFEEEPADIDSFFGNTGGTTARKPARQLEGTCLEPKVIKVKKTATDIIFSQSADIHAGRISSSALSSDEYSTVEKASVCGSKNVRPPTLDKGPPKSKSSKRPNIPRNVPIPSKASDRSSSDNSQQASTAEFHQSSENEDPNAATGVCPKAAIKAPPKSAPQQPVSASVYAASQTLFERKETSESMVLDAQILGTKSASAAAEIDESVVKGPIPTSKVRQESSQVKGRKRKSSGRNLDASVYKSLESHPSFRSGNSKSSRKVAVEVETCSESSEVLAVSTKSSSLNGTVTTCVTAGFSQSTAHTKKSPASWKMRRISDQGRRRRVSFGAKTRSRSKTSRTSSSSAKERTRTHHSEVVSTAVSSQASCSNKGSSCVGRTQNARHERDAGKSQASKKNALLVSTGETSASSPMSQVAQTVTGKCRERPSAGENDSEAEDEDSGLSLQNCSQSTQQDSPQSSGIELASASKLLSEQLQNLHLQRQRIDSAAELFHEARRTSVVRDDTGGTLAAAEVSHPDVCEDVSSEHNAIDGDDISESRGTVAAAEVPHPEVCEDVSSEHNAIDGDDISESRHYHQNFKAKSGTERLETCETRPLASEVDDIEQGKQSMVSEERRAQEKKADVPKDPHTGSSVDIAGLISSVEADLLEQLQNLRLPQEDDASVSLETSEEGKRLDEVTSATASCAHDELSGSTEELVLSNGSVSGAGKESKISGTHSCRSEKASHSIRDQRLRLNACESGIERAARHPSNVSTPKQNKRKSIDMLSHGNDLDTGRGHVAAPKTEDRHPAKTGTESSAVGSLQPPGANGRVPLVIATGQQKKMKTTCPQPFRLRTQERGALKEVEFNKKAEEILAAKENPQFSVRACEANNTLKKTQKVSTKDARWPGKTAQLRAAASACAVQNEEEIKKMRRKMIPHSQKMPSFDRPFRPHRSTKSPTIPSSPNFQHKMRKTRITPLATIED